jgi:DNA-binding protein HU-beta
MNKTELVKAIAKKANLKVVDTEKLVNAFIETVSDELDKKGKVTLTGFGTFTAAQRKKKAGINPRTGEKVTIKAKHVPGFKSSKLRAMKF